MARQLKVWIRYVLMYLDTVYMCPLCRLAANSGGGSEMGAQEVQEMIPLDLESLSSQLD